MNEFQEHLKNFLKSNCVIDVNHFDFLMVSFLKKEADSSSNKHNIKRLLLLFLESI